MQVFPFIIDQSITLSTVLFMNSPKGKKYIQMTLINHAWHCNTNRVVVIRIGPIALMVTRKAVTETQWVEDELP